MNNKRAQAAMEFLMTYGWAILVVLVVIGALAYFGVLSPQALLPEKCFLPIGLNCDQHLVTTTNAQFKLSNGLGDKITLTEMEVQDAEGTAICGGPLTVPLAIQNGASGDIDIATDTATACAMGTSGEKLRYIILVKYYKGSATTFTHTLQGELLARIE